MSYTRLGSSPALASMDLPLLQTAAETDATPLHQQRASRRRRLVKISLALFGVALLASAIAVAVYFASKPAAPSMDLPERKRDADNVFSQSYGVMLDAGSSGTRIYLYTWFSNSTSKFPQVFQLQWSMKVKNGISTFGEHPQELAGYLTPLLEYARKHIPQQQYQYTPVFLKATAGMRTLNKASRNVIMSAVRSALSDRSLCPFLFKPEWAQIISGEEEGVFGWLTVNYVTGSTLRPLSDNALHAALDLGGASTQITFVLSDRPRANYFDLYISRISFPVYTHSYFSWGADLARKRHTDALLETQSNVTLSNDTIVYDPCYFLGFNETIPGSNGAVRVGTANYTQCVDVITRNLLDVDSYCSMPPCAMNGVYQPRIPEGTKINAFSAFGYSAKFANCKGVQPLSCLEQGTKLNCDGTTMDEAAVRWPDAPYLATECFTAAYSRALLGHGYRISDTTPIDFSTVIAGIEISWTYGAMIYEVSRFDPRWK